MKGPRIYTTKRGTHVVAWPEIRKGKRVRARREFSNRAKAEALLATLQAQFPIVGAAGLSAMDSQQRADFFEAKRILPAGVSMADAARAYVAANPSASQVPIAPLVEQWLAIKESRDSSARTSESRKSRLMGFIENEGIVAISDLSPERMESWLWRRLDNGAIVARATAHAEASAIRDFCGWLVKRKRLLAANPMDQVDVGAKDDPSPRTLSAQQCRLLMNAAMASAERIAVVRSRDGVRKKMAGRFGTQVPFVAIALFAGLRPSEIGRLTPDSFAGGWIRVRKLKRGRGVRLVSVEPCLRLLLERFPPEFPIRLKRKQFERIRDKSGLGEVWQADILRHTYISARIARGDSEIDVAREAGTRPDTIHRHYRALMTKEEGEAVFGLVLE